MERRLKERLTGAAVIVMLAVIFIPMILDNSGQDELGIKATNIPPRPQMTFTPPVISAEPPPPEVRAAEPPEADPAAAPEPEPSAGPEESGTAGAGNAAAEPAPATGEQSGADGGEMQAWVVQLGSFSSGDNARGLVNRLQEAGFPAYIDEARMNTGVVYRVRVGPELRKAEAEATLDRLGKKLGLKGIVLRHP